MAKQKQKNIRETLDLVSNDSELPASQMTVLTNIVKELNVITNDLEKTPLEKVSNSQMKALKDSFDFVVIENQTLLDRASSFLSQNSNH